MRGRFEPKLTGMGPEFTICESCAKPIKKTGGHIYKFCSRECYAAARTLAAKTEAQLRSKPCQCGCGEIILQGSRTTQHFNKVKYLAGHQHKDQGFQKRRAEGIKRAYTEGKMAHAVKQSPEFIAKRTARLKGRKRQREICERISENVANAWRGGVYDGTRAARGEMNHGARIWSLRSPENKTYVFVNLCEFIRTHAELFSEEDLQMRPTSKGGFKCKAMGGLQSISPRKKYPIGSWKGWTWFSNTERKEHGGKDLIDRPEQSL